MTRSRKAPEPQQMTIDDFDVGVEHIPGGVLPSTEDAERFRANRDAEQRITYQATYLTPPRCLPDQRIHVYAANGPCQCKEIK